eukprot:857538-Pyramimonas_sp.AAC.1
MIACTGQRLPLFRESGEFDQFAPAGPAAISFAARHHLGASNAPHSKTSSPRAARCRRACSSEGERRSGQ